MTDAEKAKNVEMRERFIRTTKRYLHLVGMTRSCCESHHQQFLDGVEEISNLVVELVMQVQLEVISFEEFERIIEETLGTMELTTATAKEKVLAKIAKDTAEPTTTIPTVAQAEELLKKVMSKHSKVKQS